MKFFGYIDDALSPIIDNIIKPLLNWQFSHWYFAIPMMIIEIIGIWYLAFFIRIKFTNHTPY